MKDRNIMEAKQVIVMRKDLNMRKGKMISQGAHASLGVILDMMSELDPYDNRDNYEFLHGYEGPKWKNRNLTIFEDQPIHAWLNGPFTKITVSVNSEEELIELYEKAKEKDFPCIMIEDAGLTEFNGIKTKTCIAIGPGWDNEIDELTGHLKLL